MVRKEIVPDTLGQQRLQKVRRARRLIEVLVHHTDVLFSKRNGEFGRIIFPMKFWMYIMSPTFLFLGFVSIVLYAASVQNTMFYVISTALLVALFSTLVVFSRTKAFFRVSFCIIFI